MTNRYANAPLQRTARSTSLHDVLRMLGLPVAIAQDATQPQFTHRRVAAGQALYRAGDGFENLHLIFSGFFKLSSSDAEGNERVFDFPMKNDLIGLDGICDSHFSATATALTDSEVIELPFKTLLGLVHEVPALEDFMYRTISRSLVREQSTKTLMASLAAEARVARFLVMLSERHEAMGFSGTCYMLRMTRQDIASYLGMTIETVSRCLTALSVASMITVDQRTIQLLDKAALRTLQRLPFRIGSLPRDTAALHVS
jgi:CRP/FNR family transcriptional regulator, anaerobic regulatory protein